MCILSWIIPLFLNNHQNLLNLKYWAIMVLVLYLKMNPTIILINQRTKLIFRTNEINLINNFLKISKLNLTYEKKSIILHTTIKVYWHQIYLLTDKQTPIKISLKTQKTNISLINDLKQELPRLTIILMRTDMILYLLIKETQKCLPRKNQYLMNQKINKFIIINGKIIYLQ